MKSVTFKMTYDKSKGIDALITKWTKKWDIDISYYSIPTEISIPETDEKIEGLEVTVNFDIPTLKVPGYEFLATAEKVLIENDDKTTSTDILYTSVTGNYPKITIQDFRCDHCGTKHNRVRVHIFFKNDSNEIKIIGSSCVKDYFGIDVEKQLNNLNLLKSRINDFVEELEYCGGKARFNKIRFMSAAYYILNQMKKYESVEKTEIGEMSTKEKSLALYYSPEIIETIDIEKIKDFWFAKDQEDNFNHNVTTNLRMIDPLPGLLAYAVYKYMDEVEDFTGRFKLQNMSKNSQYVGVEREKLKNLTLTAVSVYNFKTSYGSSGIYKMHDETGNIFVWKTANYLELNVPQILKSATIKSHEEYKGTKQTTLKNCRFVERVEN